MPNAVRTRLAIVTDDIGWADAVRAALFDLGVQCVPLAELCTIEDVPLPALLIDKDIQPHGGLELADELRWVLGDVCPPILLVTQDPQALTDAERARFAAVIARSADATLVAVQTARALVHLPTKSGYVLRSAIRRPGPAVRQG